MFCRRSDMAGTCWTSGIGYRHGFFCAEIPTRNLGQLERGLEEALRNFAHGPSSDEPPPITAGERIDAIGKMSSQAIIEASETTANDILKTGEAAVEIAAELLKEAPRIGRAAARDWEKDGRSPPRIRYARKKG